MEELLLKTISALTFIVISVLTLVIVLASVGKTLGIRKFYISVLIRIFEVDKKDLAALIHFIHRAQQFISYSPNNALGSLTT